MVCSRANLNREEGEMKNRIEEEYVQIDSVDWQPFPEDFSDEVFGGNFYTCLQSWVHGQRSLIVRRIPHLQVTFM